MSNVLSLAQLQELAASVGFPNPNLAAAIAMAESGGDADAYGDVEYGGSVGLWQINLPAHPEYTEESLYDPTNNAKAAYNISSGGKSFQPWTTYRTGAYKKWYTPPAPISGAAVGLLLLVGASAYLTHASWMPFAQAAWRGAKGWVLT